MVARAKTEEQGQRIGSSGSKQKELTGKSRWTVREEELVGTADLSISTHGRFKTTLFEGFTLLFLLLYVP